MRLASVAFGLAAAIAAAGTAAAFDLNAYRRAHKLPPLSHSAVLAGLAYGHASAMASRGRLDHDGFKQRMTGNTGAENVAFGCDTEDCAFKMWTRSGRHRANMLMRGVTMYGVGSATGNGGRKYWVLELGN